MKTTIFILSIVTIIVGIFIPNKFFIDYETYLTAQEIILAIAVCFVVFNHWITMAQIPENTAINNFRVFQFCMTVVCCIGSWFLFLAVLTKHANHEWLNESLFLGISFGCFTWEIISFKQTIK